MAHSGRWQPVVDQTAHPRPGKPGLLTAPPHRPYPEPTNPEAEQAECAGVHGHPVVTQVPTHNRAQPASHLRDRIVQAPLPSLFAGFSGTTGLSDFPAPFIVGVRPWTSRHGLRRHPPQAKLGSPGSRARCFRTCPGSVTAQGPVAPCDIGAPSVAFRVLLQRRHPEVISFRGSIPGPHVPLSTLHPRPRGRRRMTRGRRGSLQQPCRFLPAHRR